VTGSTLLRLSRVFSPSPNAPLRSALAAFIVGLIIFASADAGESVTLAWDPNVDANIAGYRLHYGTAPDVYSSVLDVGNDTTGTIHDLIPGVAYYIVVTAYNADGLESPPSNEVSFTLDPATDETDASDVVEEGTAPVAFSKTTYAGLVSPPDDNPNSYLRGSLTLRTTAAGLATGQLTINGGEIYRWQGAFDATGRLAISIYRVAPFFTPLTLTLQRSADGTEITGEIADRTSSAFIDLQQAIDSLSFSSQTDDQASAMRLTQLQGRYTVIFPARTDVSESEPHGCGVGLLSVSSYGAVRLNATLADGTKFSTAGNLGVGQEFMFHAPLYGDAGFLTGKITFEQEPEISDAHGTLLWSKPVEFNAARFRSAFTIPLAMRAAKYFHAITSAPLLAGLATSAGHATVSFSDGNLPANNASTNVEANSASSATISTPPYPVIIYMRGGVPSLWAFTQPINATFDSTTGLFRGEFTPATDGRTRAFRGVLFQKGDGYGRGFFLDSIQSGEVELRPGAAF